MLVKVTKDSKSVKMLSELLVQWMEMEMGNKAEVLKSIVNLYDTITIVTNSQAHLYNTTNSWSYFFTPHPPPLIRF